MSFLGWFGGKKNDTASQDIAALAKMIGPLIDDAVKDIFARYHDILLNENITYIVYAVWGARADAPLTAVQKEINGVVIPVLDKINDIIAIRHATSEQRYTIDFLVRSIIISKITYTIEFARSKLAAASASQPDKECDDTAGDPMTELFDLFDKPQDMNWRKKFGKM